MKKIVSWCIVLTIVIGAMLTPTCYNRVYAGDFSSNIFEDTTGHWAQDFIKKFCEKKWVVGYEDGLFRPDKYVTRAEFTAMVVRIFKRETNQSDNTFADIRENDWFCNVVNYANAEGLIKGYEDGTFKPFNNMSRQDAAVLVAKLFDVNFFTGAQEYKFKDENSFPEYSYQSIKNLASHGVVQGYPDKAFRPFNLITRAEAVRMLDVVLKYIEIPTPEFPDAPPVTPSPKITLFPTSTPRRTSNSSKNDNVSKSTSTPIATPTPTATTATTTATTTPTATTATTTATTATPTTATATPAPTETPEPTEIPTPIPTVLNIDLKPVSVNIEGIITDPQTLQIGGRVAVEIENAGNDVLTDPFEVTLFEDINSNREYDSADNILGMEQVCESVYGASISVHIEVDGIVLFRDTPLYAFVDSSEVITETDQENSLRS